MTCSKKTAALAVLALAGLAQAGVLPAPTVLIEVDITDPTNVVLSATGEASLINDSASTANTGTTLLDLFTADFNIPFTPETALTGDLAGGGVLPYSSGLNDFGTLTDRDLNIYRGNLLPDFGAFQIFDTMTAAFSGSSTVDLSGASLPALGTIGDIIAGDTDTGSDVVIGQWRIVPAPGAAGLLAAAGLVGVRRRR